MFEVNMFEDLIEANRRFAEYFELGNLPARPARGLAIVTCVDTRIDPLKMLGLEPGDAKILRNAGARVTEDVLRSLILVTNLLGVDRVCVIQHTDCAVAKSTNEELQEKLGEIRDADASAWDFLAIGDQEDVLASDLKKIETFQLLPPNIAVAGFIYDVRTGRLSEKKRSTG